MASVAVADRRRSQNGRVLEIATRLDASKAADFKSGIRLESGELRFRYEETIQAQAGTKEVKVPSIIKLRLAVFFGGQQYDIEARFRYRIGPNGLTLFYSLAFIAEMELDAFRATVAQIAEQTDVPVYLAHSPIERMRPALPNRDR